MSFFRSHILRGRCLPAALLFLFLIACSGSKNEVVFYNILEEEEEERQEVPVPATFTDVRIQQLGGRVDSLFRILHKKKGFNGTVLVTKYDQVVFKGAFGFADFARKDSLTTQTAFQLASVSKQFTAMAIMMLKEKGRLQYDDSVQQYMPEFPYRGITIRHLLTHRSGLPNYTYFTETLWPNRKQPLTNEDVLSLMAEHQPKVYFRPNKRFDYSNTGYAVLATIVERASGMPFATFLKTQIFDPLEMTGTYTFRPELATEKVKMALGHIAGRRKRSPDYLDTVLGDKGMYSTVEDLYKWDQALYTQKLVRRETLEEAFAISNRINKKTEDYGFGWRIRQIESGDTVVYHGGLWHGYNTYLLRNLKDHSAIIVLSNLTNGSLNYMKDLRGLLYPAPDLSITKKKGKSGNVASTRL
jgi:CubicO group peptidase (beta-lactamase class C family)